MENKIQEKVSAPGLYWFSAKELFLPGQAPDRFRPKKKGSCRTRPAAGGLGRKPAPGGLDIPAGIEII
jgi:hypothetical protein